MFPSIDWLSFTFDMDVDQEVLAFEIWGRAAKALQKQFPLAALALVKGYNFIPRMGRAPYNASQQREDNGVMIYAHQRIPHSLVEVGGIGMDALGGIDNEIALMKAVGAKLTRMDIAVDIFTEVQPNAFAAHREGNRFSAWSESVSGSGHTVYIGSKSSDRYARVYRYFQPHPRHQFLRVEHVLRAEQARAAAIEIGDGGIEAFISKIGNTFGWQHQVWEPSENSGEAAAAWRPERREGKTVSWVHSQVVPALLKLHHRGVIDVRALYAEFIEPYLDKPNV